MALLETRTDLDAARRSVLWTGGLLGVGLIGALDEIVFHQLLQWHNFYVHTTEYWRIFSDGLFHLFTATLLAVGALRLWRQRRRLGAVVQDGLFAAGLLLGIGGFQLFDGIVNHKLLQLHPIREGVEDQLPYDLAWNGAALLVLLVGWLVWRRARTEAAAPSSGSFVGRRR